MTFRAVLDTIGKGLYMAAARDNLIPVALTC